MKRGARATLHFDGEWLADGVGQKIRGGWGTPSGGPSKGPQFFEVFMRVNWLPCTPEQLLKNGDVIIHNSLVMEVTNPKSHLGHLNSLPYTLLPPSLPYVLSVLCWLVVRRTAEASCAVNYLLGVFRCYVAAYY